MLALLGLATILVLLGLLITNRCSATVALIVVPIVAALIGGFGLHTSAFIVEGVKAVAPTATTFIFAILYFGVVADAGMLEPVVNGVLRAVGNSPKKIVVGTAVLAILVHLDGSAAVCFLITMGTMLPLYDKLGMDRRVLACTAGLAAGMNILPWVAPTLRSSAVLKVPPSEIFYPLIVPAIIGILYVLLIAYWLGAKEERRLLNTGSGAGAGGAVVVAPTDNLANAADDVENALRRPKLFWFNVVLTLCVMGILIAGLVEPMVMFMVGTAIALIVNYRSPAEHTDRISAHAKAAMMMASILLASGVFAGILHQSGMLDAMAKAAGSFISPSMGQHIPTVLAFLAAPLTLFFDADSYYFGVLPVVAKLYAGFGGNPLDIARASLMGLHTAGATLSPTTPITFLLIGLTGLTLGQYQRFSALYIIGGSWVMAATSVALGVF